MMDFVNWDDDYSLYINGTIKNGNQTTNHQKKKTYQAGRHFRIRFSTREENEDREVNAVLKK